jgi:hypothetical protein
VAGLYVGHPFNLYIRSKVGAPNTAGADDDVIVPEGIGVATIRLPSEIDGSNLGLKRAPLPLSGVGIINTGLDGKSVDGVSVQPSLNGTVGSYVVLEALPTAGGKGGRGSNALRGEVGKRRVVSLAVVHQDLALASNTQVFLSTLGRVGHGDEGDVSVGEGLGGFSASQETCISKTGIF